MGKKRSPAKIQNPAISKLDTLAKEQHPAAMDAAGEKLAKPFTRAFGTSTSQRKHPDILLRNLAGVYYTTDPKGCTVAELQKDPRFSHIPLRRLEEWSATDDWPERRKDYWLQAQDRIVQQMLDELTRSRMIVRRQMEIAANAAYHKLVNNLVPASSWEGVANCYRGLVNDMDSLMLKIIDNPVIAPPQLAASPVATTLEMSEEEAHDAAMFLLDRRQRQQQQALEAAKDVTGGGNGKAPKEG